MKPLPSHVKLTRVIAQILGTSLIATESISPTFAADATANAGGSGNDVQEVIVTARRRAESIIDVPYNISAVSGDKIAQDHVIDTAELMRSVPGVSVVDRGDRNSSIISGIRIRGLNVDSSALGDYAVSAAATVSTYVNDTPIFANFLLSDLDRVEVLKGPQGTLYGSGAIGGTVRYITHAPDLGKWDGEVTGTLSHVQYSNSVGTSGTLTLNMPLGETAAVRMTLTHNMYPGVTDYVNIYQLDAKGVPVAPQGITDPAASYRSSPDADFAHQNYARVALLWRPNEAFSTTLTLTGQEDRFGGRRGTTLGTNGDGVPYSETQIGSIQAEPGSRNVYLASLEANVDLGFATLTSSTSQYNHHGATTSESTGYYAQANFLPFYYNYPRPDVKASRTYQDKAFIEEVRLVSAAAKHFDYVLGAYYQNQSLRSSQDGYIVGYKQWWDLVAPAYAQFVTGDQNYLYRQTEHYREAALYGELTWHATDTLQFTGGYRIFSDNDTNDVHQELALDTRYFGEDTSGGNIGVKRGIFKGNAAWHFASNQQIYATVAEGYRRGGSNGTATTGRFPDDPRWQTYGPDTDINYEMGVKGIEHGVTYNADVFFVDWQNPQLNSSTPNGVFAVQNGRRAITKGIELQAAGYITRNWHYALGYTYTDARLAADLVAADNSYVVNVKGAQLPGAPRSQFNFATDFTIPFTLGSLTLHGDGYYQSSTQDTLFSSNIALNSVPGSPYIGQPQFYYPMKGFWIFNTSAAYNVSSWTAILWMKNVGNSPGVTGVYTPAYMGTLPVANYFGNGSKALITLPRAVGITLNYKF